jgi:3-hydroxymyristoyl/3-hydroxydecanoyl-(acyl carrier protein) dehydratase
VKLPHRFPFRLIDRTGPDGARLALSADAYWLRGSGHFPPAFCVEVVAQAAASLLAGVEDGPGQRQRWLAGIDRVEVLRPVRAGESLEVRVQPVGRFAGIARISGQIFSGTEKVAEATLLLV